MKICWKMLLLLKIFYLSLFLIIFQEVASSFKHDWEFSPKESSGGKNVTSSKTLRSRRADDRGLAQEPPWLRAKRLVEDLFANYSKLVRPRLNQSQTVNVRFDIRLKQLVEVDIKSQQVTF